MKIFLLLLLLMPGAIAAQLSSKEHFEIALTTDPYAYVSEVPTGFNIGVEGELVSHWGYVRPFISLYPEMKAPFMQLGAGLGINLKLRRLPIRYYLGGRLGVIYRDWQPAGYATGGAEAGINFYTRGRFSFGLRAVYELRSDFEYYNNPAEWKATGLVRVGYKF